MVDKIKITRLNEKIPELSNNTGKLICVIIIKQFMLIKMI